MTAVTATVEVARPARDVYEYATDPSRFHECQKGVVDGHLASAQEPRVGDECVTVRRIGFANRPITSEVTVVDATAALLLAAVDGLAAHAVSVTEPTDACTLNARLEMLLDALAPDRA